MKRASGQDRGFGAIRQRSRRGGHMQPIVRGLPEGPPRAVLARRRHAMDRMLFANIELKFSDLNYSGALVASANASGGESDPATVLSLNGVNQGDGPSEREGRQVVQHDIMLRGSVSVGPTTNAVYTNVEPCTVWIALVLDTQTNGAQLNSEDVFVNSAASVEQAPFVFRNLGYDKRFRVLKTKRITFDSSLVSAIAGPVYTVPYQVKPFEMYSKLRGIKTTYVLGSTSAAIANITDNSLHVIAFCDKTDLTPTLRYNSRLRFTG